MKLSADELARKYALGYRAPAGDLFQTDLLRQWKSQHGVLPGERESDPFPAAETPHGDQHAESKTPKPTTENNERSRLSPPQGVPREREVARPLPDGHPEQRDRVIDRYVNVVPDAEPDSRDRRRTETPIRTLGIPGEQWGNPTKFDYNMPTRRVSQFPKERQRDQRQKAKRVSLQWYRRNRSKHVRRSQRRYRRIRYRSQFKRTNKLRHRFPTRFKRRPGGGYRSPAKRTKDWREQRMANDEAFDILWGSGFNDAVVTGFDPVTNEIQVAVFRSSPMDEPGTMYPKIAPKEHSLSVPEFYAQANFWDEQDALELAEAIDEHLGPAAWSAPPEDVESPWVEYEAGYEDEVVEGLDRMGGSLWHTQYYEEAAPERWPKTRDERKDEQDAQEYEDGHEAGVPHGTRTTPTYPDRPDNWPPIMTRAPYVLGPKDDNIPATPLNSLTPVEQSGGSSKVIPWNADVTHNQDFSVRKADTISMIRRRTDNKTKQRAKDRPARITGYDSKRNLWFFQSGKYFQRLRAIPKPGSKATNVTQMDVLVSCSCPAWRWQGPEHWSKEHNYLYNRNRTRGTAEFPEIRDPKFRHAVCKHMIAVFDLVEAKRLKIKRSAVQRRADGTQDYVLLADAIVPVESLRYLLDSPQSDEAPSLDSESLVARYLGQSHSI